MDTLKQQEAEQAVPVGSPSILTSAVRETRKDYTDEPIESEMGRKRKLLDQMSESDGWVVLKELLEAKIVRMRKTFNDRLVAGKIDLQDVGLRSLIINEVGNAFQEVINLVELSKRKVVIPPDDSMPETVNEEVNV